MAEKRGLARRRIAVTVVACLCAVHTTSSMPPPVASSASSGIARKLFFDEGQQDGEVVTAAHGEDVVLHCHAVGTPMPSIHWLRSGRRIIQGNRHDVRDDLTSFESPSPDDDEGGKAVNLGSTRSRLYIDCVRPSDAGVYMCIAETPTRRIVTTLRLRVVPLKGKHLKRRGNGVLPVKDADAELPAEVRRSLSESCINRHSKSDRSPARIFQWTSQRLANEGRDTQLFCRASGTPPPTVTWYDRDEREILPDDSQHEILPNGDLLIRDVSWSRNMGLYHCKAHNEFGSDAIDTFLYPTTA